jgi:hypothetical protein
MNESETWKAGVRSAAQIAEGPPTKRQLRYIRQLAVKRQRTYAEPRTFSQANRLIHELKYGSAVLSRFL